MNAITPSIQKPPANLQPLGVHRATANDRAVLRLAFGIGLLTLVVVLSAYAVLHSAGIVVDLP